MASATLDPRGTCLWTFVVPQPALYCLHPDTGIPNVDYSLDLATLSISNLSQTPVSALTIANASGPIDPIMLLATRDVTVNPFRRGYLVAIRLNSRTLLWSKLLGLGEATFSQFPIVLAPGLRPRIAVPTNKQRVSFWGRN